jgi:hypothetical protein
LGIASSICDFFTPKQNRCEVAESMFVPLFLDQVRVKDRPEVFMVFRLDRAKQTADVFCLGSDVVERGVHWTLLKHPWDDR